MEEKKTYTKEEILAELPEFSGTFYYYNYYSLLLTDGAMFLAEAARCFWLIDILWSIHHLMRRHDMVVCTLEVNEDRTAVFTAIGDREEIVHRQEIPYTDFPLDSTKLYYADGVVLLPGEY